jgi:hypothetical protein
VTERRGRDNVRGAWGIRLYITLKVIELALALPLRGEPWENLEQRRE